MLYSRTIRQSLYLLSVPNFGPASYWKLIEQFGSLDAVFNTPIQKSQYCKKPLQDALTQHHKEGDNAPLWQHVNALCEWLDTQNIHVLNCTHNEYPLLLKSIIKPPPLIFIKGTITALALPQIAIVGSRKITASGEKTTLTFAQELAQAGFVITSGLALGVDAAAHHGALKGQGQTIAVMATGIDAIYPKKHQYLADQIIDHGGALVTEFFPHSSPKAHHFPQRNRIISGLACGLLVVEAALKSGSLISARYATEQNREVFAVPGSIHSPVSRGCHALIKNGAKLVETAQDIVEELGSMLCLHADVLTDQCNVVNNAINAEPSAIDLNQTKALNTNPIKAKITVIESHASTDSDQNHCEVLRCIDFSVTPLDDIMTHCNKPIDDLMSRLLELELEGRITHDGAGYTRLS